MAVKATFEAKIKDTALYPLLNAIAGLFGRVERALFRDHYLRGEPLKDCKRRHLRMFGITARMFNAAAAVLAGKVKAARDARERHAERLKGKIRSLAESVAGLEQDVKQAQGQRARWRLRFQIHQKKRRLAGLQAELEVAEESLERTVPRICFGSNRLFRRQFHLRENGYRTHEEWLSDWRDARSSQFLCLGSRDEKRGNQTCALLPDGTLRLRVPDALAKNVGGKWVLIAGVRFRYGQNAIDRALAEGQALTYRFLRRERKGRPVCCRPAACLHEDTFHCDSNRSTLEAVSSSTLSAARNRRISLRVYSRNRGRLSVAVLPPRRKTSSSSTGTRHTRPTLTPLSSPRSSRL